LRANPDALGAYAKGFKTPGAKVAIATGSVTKNTTICNEETIAHLIQIRQEALRRIAEKRALPASRD